MSENVVKMNDKEKEIVEVWMREDVTTIDQAAEILKMSKPYLSVVASNLRKKGVDLPKMNTKKKILKSKTPVLNAGLPTVQLMEDNLEAILEKGSLDFAVKVPVVDSKPVTVVETHEPVNNF
jgi:hypothetical protein